MAAHQASPSPGFSRQEYWSELPFPFSEDLSDPGIEPRSPALQAASLSFELQENPMDGGAWWAAVHGVAKSQARLSDLTFTFHFHALEKEMATHSSVLAWRIQGQRSLVGCHLWGCTESDMTEVT